MEEPWKTIIPIIILVLVLGGTLMVGAMTHWSFRWSKHPTPSPSQSQCVTGTDCPTDAVCVDNQCVSHRRPPHPKQTPGPQPRPEPSPGPEPQPKGDSRWWLSIAGQTYGPYDSLEEMRGDLTAKGISISPSSQVWQPGSTKWVAAFVVPGLVSLPDQVCGNIRLGDTSVQTDGTTIPLTWDISLSGAGEDCFSRIGSGAFMSRDECNRDTELAFVDTSPGSKGKALYCFNRDTNTFRSLTGQANITGLKRVQVDNQDTGTFKSTADSSPRTTALSSTDCKSYLNECKAPH